MDQEKFLEVCVEEYSDKMFDIKDSALSASDLQDSHQAFKDEILETLQSKWRAASGESSVPDELRKKLTKELDSTFNKLKRMFERKNKREQNELAAISIAKDCLNFYNDEMDQYFKNNPNLSPKDIDKVHSKITAQTFSKAKSKSGGEISSNLMTLLKRDTEARKVVYIERAEMIMKSNEDPAIGIDLGTTMCCVMVFYKGECKLVPNWSQGSARTTPSYVAFTEDGKDTFGIDAKEEAYKQPETTIYDAKRMIGRHFNDIMLQSDLQKWPFEVINEDGNVKIKTWDRIRYPHEVSARLLTRFRLMAEDFLHVPRGSIKKAVITVPAYFTEPQRRATSDAAKCAGLEVLNILSEPTAAAIAYSWDRHDVGITRKALIYDLGGGTFDVAIAKVTRDKVEILCVDGDTHLGGQDFDQQLMDYCIQEFEDKESINLAVLRNSTEPEKRHNARSALSRLKLQCEKAKERLTTSEKAIVQVEKIYGNKDLWVEVTKVMFERLIRTLIRSTIDIVEKAIAEAKSKGVESKNDIDDIILVGGSTRLPIVIEMVSDFFGGKQLCKNINPDEAVAFGAAIQAAILNKNGTVKKIFVQDVTPMSLGVDVVGDKLSIVIPKNSNIPCTFKESYVTAYDNQTRITWEVYQGENPVSSKNYKLGEFSTEGLIPMPAGFQEVTVTMRFDASGMLHVNAVSESTGRYNSITIAADRMGMDTNTISRLTNECKQIKNF